MNLLRSRVSELMVRIHLIPPDLAEYHVRQMTPADVRRRFLVYVRLGLTRPGAFSGNAPKTEWQDAVRLRSTSPAAGNCPICLQFSSRLVRDHDHKTGEIRGRICDGCNGRIAMLESVNPRTIRRRQGRLAWLKWMHDNAERIQSHLQKHTGVFFRVSGPIFPVAEGAIGNLTINGMGNRAGKMMKVSAHAGSREFPRERLRGAAPPSQVGDKMWLLEGGKAVDCRPLVLVLFLFLILPSQLSG